MTRDDILRLAREAGFKFAPAQFSGVLEAEVSEFDVERFAALVLADARSQSREIEAMAECMDMVRQDLITAGIIDKAVPPMMLPEAVIASVQKAVAAEREACAQLAQWTPDPLGLSQKIAAAIRDRGQEQALAEVVRLAKEIGQEL